jgi:hypothetical protein
VDLTKDSTSSRQSTKLMKGNSNRGLTMGSSGFDDRKWAMIKQTRPMSTILAGGGRGNVEDGAPQLNNAAAWKTVRGRVSIPGVRHDMSANNMSVD